MDPTAASEGRPPSLSAAVSNLIVSLVREYSGRGPTKAKAYIHDDLIVVVLADTLTRGEQQLVDAGRGEHVLLTRKLYQDAMRDAATTGIEALVGRRVIGFMSDNHIDPDLGVETFVMESTAAASA